MSDAPVPSAPARSADVFCPLGIWLAFGTVFFVANHFLVPKILHDLMEAAGPNVVLPAPTVLVVNIAQHVHSFWYAHLAAYVLGAIVLASGALRRVAMGVSIALIILFGAGLALYAFGLLVPLGMIQQQVG